ncbi:MAG TPA: hypothetical protein VMM13_04960, partial [Euzebya sp.]|nr:hypothetical protein [Euzebya sp.]
MTAEHAVEETVRDRGVTFRRLDPRVRVVWWLGSALGAVPWVVGAVLLGLFIDLPGPRWALPVGITLTLLVLVVGVPML